MSLTFRVYGFYPNESPFVLLKSHEIAHNIAHNFPSNIS